MVSVNSLTENAKGLGLMVIVIAVVLAILSGFQGSGALGTTANATVGTGITEISSIVTDWLGIIILIIVGVYLMGGFKQFSK